MADHENPLEALCAEVTAIMAANGNGHVPHFFGGKAKNYHQRPPRYVWVPSRIADREETPTRTVEEFRTLFAFSEHVVIFCHGRSYAEVSALRRNLLVALHHSAYADVNVEHGEYVNPGKNVIQDGEAFSLEVSLRVPVPDAYVEIAETLTEPEPDTFVPTDFEGETYLSPDTATDGEPGPTVDTDDE